MGVGDSQHTGLLWRRFGNGCRLLRVAVLCGFWRGGGGGWAVFLEGLVHVVHVDVGLGASHAAGLLQGGATVWGLCVVADTIWVMTGDTKI